MKKEWLFPLTALSGGVAAFILRLLQNRTGYESSTGLPIPGSPAALALIILFVALAAVLLRMVLRMPKDSAPAFPTAFSTSNPAYLTLPVMGVFLILLSGLADLAEALGAGNLIAAMQNAAGGEAILQSPGTLLSGKLQLILGLLSLLTAASLFLVVIACRANGKQASDTALPADLALVVPPAALVVRLVMIYRLDSVNPSLQQYYVTLLALVFLTLGFYRLASFAFEPNRTRNFSFYAGMSVVFSLAALADGGYYLSSLLLYAGGALTLLGFLLLLSEKSEESVDFH